MRIFRKKQSSPPRGRRIFTITWTDEWDRKCQATMRHVRGGRVGLRVGDEREVEDVQADGNELYLHLRDGSLWELFAFEDLEPGDVIRITQILPGPPA